MALCVTLSAFNTVRLYSDWGMHSKEKKKKTDEADSDCQRNKRRLYKIEQSPEHSLEMNSRHLKVTIGNVISGEFE